MLRGAVIDGVVYGDTTKDLPPEYEIEFLEYLEEDDLKEARRYFPGSQDNRWYYNRTAYIDGEEQPETLEEFKLTYTEEDDLQLVEMRTSPGDLYHSFFPLQAIPLPQYESEENYSIEDIHYDEQSAIFFWTKHRAFNYPLYRDENIFLPLSFPKDEAFRNAFAQYGWQIDVAEEQVTFGGSQYTAKVFNAEDGFNSFSYHFVKDIGIYKFKAGFVNSDTLSYTLKGALIDGETYGETGSAD